MAVRPVLLYPDPLLKQPAEPAQTGTPELEQLVADMLDTMRAGPRCVGLAAPQIGALVRLIVVDVSEHPKAVDPKGLLVIANPVVTSAEGSEVGREGCLSIPDFTANVRRATSIVVEGAGADGAAQRVEAVGFEARCLLHEIDHLDGILFLDRVDSIKRDVFARRGR